MKRGFTLIELILYVGITAMILSILSGSVFLFLNSRIKTQTITNVQNDIVRSSNFISQLIRDADGVNLPTQGNSSTSLNLIMSDPSLNPTIISLSGGKIVVEQGGNGQINLTNQNTEITNLEFSNNSKNNTSDIIKISIDVEHINNSGRNEFEYSKSFTTSASILEYD